MLAKIARAVVRFPDRCRHQGLGNAFYRYLEPVFGRRAVVFCRYLKIALRPFAYLARKGGGRLQHHPVDLSNDFARLPDGFLETDRVVKHCNEVFERKRAKLEATFDPPYGMVLTFENDGKRLWMADPEEYRPIVEMCAQPRLFQLASRYIGEYPVISNVSLIYTMPNDTTVGPQQWHRDMNSPRQLHVVVPIWPIDADCGPFTFLPGDKSVKVIEALDHVGGRVSDEEFFRLVSKDDIQQITGPAGSAFVINPYRCFHMGGRARKKPRLILIVNLSSYFEGTEGAYSPSRSANRHMLNDGRFETRSLLAL